MLTPVVRNWPTFESVVDSDWFGLGPQPDPRVTVLGGRREPELVGVGLEAFGDLRWKLLVGALGFLQAEDVRILMVKVLQAAVL